MNGMLYLCDSLDKSNLCVICCLLKLPSSVKALIMCIGYISQEINGMLEIQPTFFYWI